MTTPTPTPKPQRIQLKRTRGFNLQDASQALNGLPAVRVSRPTKWGNPFVVERAGDGVWMVRDANGIIRFARPSRTEAHYSAIRLYRAYLNNDGTQPGAIRDCGGAFLKQIAAEELRGKNLACFCPLDHGCHADILLELANG